VLRRSRIGCSIQWYTTLCIIYSIYRKEEKNVFKYRCILGILSETVLSKLFVVIITLYVYIYTSTRSVIEKLENHNITSTMQVGEEEVDFTSPDYILQNIKYEDNFETFDNFSSTVRARVIRNICDQVCFYVANVLKAFTESERLPTIWIYGAGYLGSSVIESLCECGCMPMLKIFARDEMVINLWREKGIKAVKRLKEGQFVDIMIICSNLASFSQFCRDISDFVSPKSCFITTVFGLQRCRLFNILRTPGIFRTFVEHEAPVYDIEDVVEVSAPAPPSRSRSPPSMRSKSPSSMSTGGSSSPFARQSAKSPKWTPSGPSPLSSTVQVAMSKKEPVPLSPMEVSARFLASRKNAVRNLIVLLENYYIIGGMQATRARTLALASVVGVDSAQPAERPPPSVALPVSCPGGATVGESCMGAGDDDAASVSSERSGLSSQRRGRSSELIQSESVLSHTALLLQDVIGRLQEKYCRHFQVELSKHILVLDLPRVSDGAMDDVGSPLGRTRKNLKSRISRQPTRGVVGTPLSNWELRFLGDPKLIEIFKLDSKSAYINDKRNPYLEELAGESDDEEETAADKKKKKEGAGAESIPAPAAKKQDMERYYILRYDSSNFDAKPAMALPSLGKPSFYDVVGGNRSTTSSVGS
jgi:hypothetical protein